MLIQFSVENYMSFKDRAVLCLSPSVDKEHPENILNKNTYAAVNAIAIYGANASGKTSLFRAMTAAALMITNSNLLQVNQPIFYMVPFKFDQKTIKDPSKFEFIFVADDGFKYVYGFSATQFRIYEEYLYQYKTQKPTIIFERKDEEYRFKSQKALLEPLVRFNTPNKLFLATATNWNTECTLIPYKWLSEKILTFTEAQVLTNLSLAMYKGEKQRKYINFTENLLQQADINISKIHFRIRKNVGGEMTDVMMPQIMINGQPTQAQYEQVEIRTEHRIGNGEKKTSYSLGLGEESLGTNQLFILGPFLKDAFETGTTVVIDEIDKSLHTHIVKYIISLFRNSEVNKAGAQLIFTTHDTSLLSLATFRRDQVYFTEKNNETGESELYSLDEFPVRKTDNIEKGYLMGRYGAIPYVQGGN